MNDIENTNTSEIIEDVNKVETDVSKKVRETVVSVAAGAQTIKNKGVGLAQNLGKKWGDLKPRQEQVKDSIVQAGKDVVNFGKDVTQGVKDGVAEVYKKKQ